MIRFWHFKLTVALPLLSFIVRRRRGKSPGGNSVKRLRRSQAAWYVPPPPPAVAVFACRGCRAPLTGPLRLVDDPATLGVEDLTPLVPPGRYWPVAEAPPGGAAGSDEMVPGDFGFS